MITEAQKKYADKAASVAQQLALLSGLVAFHGRRAGDAATWAQVGDLDHLEKRLAELCEFMVPAA